MEKIETRDQQEWKEQIHLLAKKLYTITMVMYLLYMFFRLVFWNEKYIYGSVFPFFIEALGCCRYFFAPLLLEKIIRSWRKGLITAALLGVAWWVSRVSNVHNNLFEFMAFLLLSDLGEKQKILRWNLAVRLSIIVILTGMLVLERVLFTSNISGRHTLGFANENTTSAFVLSILLLIWQLGLKKSKILTFFIFWAFMYPVYFYEDCETVMALLFVFPICQVVIEGISHGKHSSFLKVTIAIPIVLAIINVGVMLWLSSFETVPYWNIWPWEAFSQRFGDAANLYKLHGVTLLGLTEPWTLGYTTDNLFLNTLLCHGIVALIMVTGAFSWLFYRFYQKKQYDLITITFLLMIYSIMESITISVFFNFVPLLALTNDASRKKERIIIKDWFYKNKTKLITSSVLLLCSAVSCLLIHPTEEVGRITPLIYVEPNKVASSPLSEKEVQVQTFEATENFQGVRIYMATYHKYPIMELTATLQNEEGIIIASKKIKTLVVDNTYQTILFDEMIEAGRYALSVSGKTKLGAVVIWQAEGNLYPAGAIVENGMETDRDWIMGLINDTVSKETGKVWICALCIVSLIIIWMAPKSEKRFKKRY